MHGGPERLLHSFDQWTVRSGFTLFLMSSGNTPGDVIRVSSRTPKPKKFPEDYYGAGVVQFDENGVWHLKLLKFVR